MIVMPSEWKVRTSRSRGAALAMRVAMRCSISLRASRAKARSRRSEAGWRPASISQAALATITEVLPLPAAAMTRLCCSSVTTAVRCSAVSGRASMRSKKVREAASSLRT